MILHKTVYRETEATIFDRGKARNLIVTLEPTGRHGALIGVRLKGTRETYRVSLTQIYTLAVDQHLKKIERRTKELIKEGYKFREAKKKAVKELEKSIKNIKEEV